MKVLKNDITDEILINKSRFITYVCKANSDEEAKKILFDIKNKYSDATHYCYAYIIDNIRKYDDDGEPSGTAGKPIMEVLLKSNLNYVIGIVIRHFGGIKLGAGGLVRAYAKGISQALKKSSIEELVLGKECKICFEYDKLKDVNLILKDTNIVNKEYGAKIIYTIDIKIDKIDKVENKLKSINIDIDEIKDIYIVS